MSRKEFTFLPEIQCQQTSTPRNIFVIKVVITYKTHKQLKEKADFDEKLYLKHTKKDMIVIYAICLNFLL